MKRKMYREEVFGRYEEQWSRFENIFYISGPSGIGNQKFAKI